MNDRDLQRVTGILRVGDEANSPNFLRGPQPLALAVIDARHQGAQTIMGNALIDAPARITLQEFAEREGIPLSTARWWVRIGYAPSSYRLGKHRVMDLGEVIRWESALRAGTR